jgi:hypothetical protein
MQRLCAQKQGFGVQSAYCMIFSGEKYAPCWCSNRSDGRSTKASNQQQQHTHAAHSRETMADPLTAAPSTSSFGVVDAPPLSVSPSSALHLSVSTASSPLSSSTCSAVSVPLKQGAPDAGTYFSSTQQVTLDHTIRYVPLSPEVGCSLLMLPRLHSLVFVRSRKVSHTLLHFALVGERHGEAGIGAH